MHKRWSSEMSGFPKMSGSTLQGKIANEIAHCTPKPDRITVDQIGCKVQGSFQ